MTVQLDTPVTLQAGEKTELFAVVNAGTVEHPKMEVYATDETGKEIVYTKDSFSQPSYEITRQKRAAFGFTLESGTEYDYAQEVADALVKGGSIVIERDVDPLGEGTDRHPGRYAGRTQRTEGHLPHPGSRPDR